ncbi:MAG: ferredoxin [Akkermansiaceae bacterium]|nr:ferredoxin [Akkermansiaceae bacterium]
MIKIRHKKPECIGCKLCADEAPQHFEMDDEGLAQLLHSNQQGVFQVADGFDEDLQDLKRAEEGCPVDIIHIQG